MNAPVPAQDQWMVRSHRLYLAGPFSRAQVLDLIRKGKLNPHDEVCRANGHWFALHEDHEVRKQLNVQLNQKAAVDPEEEITETGTTPIAEVDKPRELRIPDLPEIEEIEIEDSESQIGAEEIQPILAETPPAPRTDWKIGVPETLGKVERPSVWKAVAWALGMVVVVLLITVLNLISTS